MLPRSYAFQTLRALTRLGIGVSEAELQRWEGGSGYAKQQTKAAAFRLAELAPCGRPVHAVLAG